MLRSPTLELITHTSRRRITLGKELGRGGAGTVVEIDGDPSTVAKLYHEPTLAKASADEERKIQAMVAQAPDLSPIPSNNQSYVQIAWPTATLLRDGKFAGFGMPALEVSRTRELEYLLVDKQAAQFGLRSDVGVRVTVARQLAGLIAALHAKGHYVVDMKPLNLSYYPDALYMAVLDCDGFNIHDEKTGVNYPAPMFTPEYLAPEFQAQGSNPNSDPRAQDKFALAVVIFQLLCHGVHPYDGILSSRRNLERPVRIAHGYYPYGLAPNPTCSPNPFCTYQCVPKGLLECFERAFLGDPARRPSAQEWVDHLEKYASRQTRNLVPCNVNPKHVRFAGLCCSQCERANRLVRRLVPRQASQRPAVPLPGSAPRRRPTGSPRPASGPGPSSVAKPRSSFRSGSSPKSGAKRTHRPRRRLPILVAVVVGVLVVAGLLVWVLPGRGGPRTIRQGAASVAPATLAVACSTLEESLRAALAKHKPAEVPSRLFDAPKGCVTQPGITSLVATAQRRIEQATTDIAAGFKQLKTNDVTSAEAALKRALNRDTQVDGADRLRAAIADARREQHRAMEERKDHITNTTSSDAVAQRAVATRAPTQSRVATAVTNLLARGRSALRQKNYAAAEAAARTALSLEPDNNKAQALLRDAQEGERQALYDIVIH